MLYNRICINIYMDLGKGALKKLGRAPELATNCN